MKKVKKEVSLVADFKAQSGFWGGAGFGNWGFIIFLIFILLVFGVGFFGGFI